MFPDKAAQSLIRPNSIEPRAYQLNIAASCMANSTLVVLPTGLGKTVVALYVIASRLGQYGKKALFLAPTKPLVEQHARFLSERLLVEPITAFTGEVSPKKRLEAWNASKIVVSTPQVIENDVIAGNINLSDVGLLIFDEAHRAVGNYSYVFIAEKYKAAAQSSGQSSGPHDGLTLGITASPGSKAKDIMDVCSALNISNVEIRSEADPDVAPYVHRIKIDWMAVEVPSGLRGVMAKAQAILEENVAVLRSLDLVKPEGRVSTTDILAAQPKIQAHLAAGEGFNTDGSPNPFYGAATAQAVALKANHAIELAETQGLAAVRSYFERLLAEAGTKGSSRASKILAEDPRFLDAVSAAKSAKDEHPKLERVVGIVGEALRVKPDSRIIVFTQYRDTSELVAEKLNRIKGVAAARFIGQASRTDDKGLSQKEQAEIIKKFTAGEYNVLVATSVAEEGLDIPSTDLVVFYEPIPSEIRTIQRRGRTGRARAGRVIVLIAKKTRDEAYYWSSKKKEVQMRQQLAILRAQLKAANINVGLPRVSAVSQPKEDAPTQLPEAKQDSGGAETEAKLSQIAGGHEIPRDAQEAAPISKIEHSKEHPQEHSKTNTSQPISTDSPSVPRQSEREKRIKGKKEQGTQQSGGRILQQKLDFFELGAPKVAGTTNKEMLAKESQNKDMFAKEPSGNEEPITESPLVLSKPAAMAAEGQPSPEPLIDCAKISDNSAGGLEIIVDSREFPSGVARELSKLGIKVKPSQLETGDYILSDRAAVERKTAEDFLSSLMDGRLFSQMAALKRAYFKPIVVLEGSGLFTIRKMNPASIYGALASIVTDYNIPIFFTKDERETAEFLAAVAKHEAAKAKDQEDGRSRAPAARGDKGGTAATKERQQFIIEGLPNVSGVLAQRLLAHFGSVGAIMSAEPKELVKVKGVGKKIAEDIRKIVDEKYIG